MLADLLPSWKLALTAERKSLAAIATYTEGAGGFLRWCAETGTKAEIAKANVQAFTAALLEVGAEASTARTTTHGPTSLRRMVS